MNPKFKKVLRIIGEYLILTFATFLYTAAWEWFVAPNGYSSGGLTGLLLLVQYATGGAVQVHITYLIANVALLILAFFILGKGFGIKTIYCIAVSTLFFSILPHMDYMFCVEGGLLYVPDSVLIPIIAGVVEGIGLGIVLRFGGSTGGSDIFAMIINKYWPVSPGRFYLVTDSIIIAMVLLFPDKGFSDVVYGYIMMIASAVFVDFVVVGSKSSVQLIVFSEKPNEIRSFILNKMDRGVTILKAVGGYSEEEKDVLLILLRSKELPDVTAAIKEIDEKAFVSVSPANSVFGEGFEEMKTGLKLFKRKK